MFYVDPIIIIINLPINLWNSIISFKAFRYSKFPHKRFVHMKFDESCNLLRF